MLLLLLLPFAHPCGRNPLTGLVCGFADDADCISAALAQQPHLVAQECF
jgi:hypothetical protein